MKLQLPTAGLGQVLMDTIRGRVKEVIDSDGRRIEIIWCKLWRAILRPWYFRGEQFYFPEGTPEDTCVKPATCCLGNLLGTPHFWKELSGIRVN